MNYVLIYKRDKSYSAAVIHKASSVTEAKAKALQHIARWNAVLRWIGSYSFIDILEIPEGGGDLVVQYIQSLERRDAKVQSVL